MSPFWTFVCYLLGFVALVAAAAGVTVRRVSLLAAGLALWLLPTMWAAAGAID